ncbi:MAG: hypothetical protein HKL91_03595 [Candidatus Eremiobacteraeota bacterium]|uniref:Uncharacterized protein n=1 Tax=mine drainage metagenome TaxID=410659 RepID=E6PES4_9ZZZZ|nr:hypothetical protein [Candidatus Eremiobacteraeota bacterium]
MIRNQYRERWAEWLPSALRALANDPPDFPAVMPAFPLPEIDRHAFTRPNNDLRVALITSSGAYDTKMQAPFASGSIIGDASYRAFDIDLPTEHIDDISTIVIGTMPKLLETLPRALVTPYGDAPIGPPGNEVLHLQVISQAIGILRGATQRTAPTLVDNRLSS